MGSIKVYVVTSHPLDREATLERGPDLCPVQTPNSASSRDCLVKGLYEQT
jgi:hypothetical protein